MADNVAVTAGSGTSIAADEVVDGTLGTVKVQYVKIMDGTLDGTTKVATGSGTGNGMRVVVDSSQLASLLTSQGAFAAGAQQVSLPSDHPPLPVGDLDFSSTQAVGMTGLRDHLVAQRTTILADSLIDGIAGFWTQSTANGGTITNSVGEGQLKTSTATNGSSQLVSTSIPYFPGQVNWMNSAIRMGDTGTAGNIRRVGMFTVSGTTPQDGFYFELSGTTLNAVYVKAGSATATASTSWSKVSTAPFTLDTNYHSYEIRYTANSVWFYVDNILRHAVSGTSTPLTTTLTLPITLTNVKTSGATDITLACRNIGNGRFGMPGGTVNETGLSAVEARAVGGGTPHDSVDSGNPLKVGGYATTALPTAVASADRVNALFDKFGRQIMQPITIRDLTGTQTTTISASTTETTIVTAGGAGVFNDLVMLVVSNTSASTNTRIDFRDATAGTVLFSLQSNGGQPPVGFCPAVAIPQTTANSNWTAQCATSTTDVRIYAVYAKNK